MDFGCLMIGINYMDEFYDVFFLACYKIFREWVVLDWCQYDLENLLVGGCFLDVQVIKVEDFNFLVMVCLDDVIVVMGFMCGQGLVVFFDVIVDDCSINIFIINDFFYVDVGGVNGSGIYLEGIIVVNFYVNDCCGNVLICFVEVMVEDQIVLQFVCIVGLFINLVMMNGEFMVMINVGVFDGSIVDNCIFVNEIDFIICCVGIGQFIILQLMFICEDVGNQMIEFWVEDVFGNSVYCFMVIVV